MIWYILNVQSYSNWRYYNVSLIRHWIAPDMPSVSWMEMSYPVLDEAWIRNVVSKILNAGYQYRIDHAGNTYVFWSNWEWIQSS